MTAPTRVLSVQPHAVAVEPTGGTAETPRRSPSTLDDADLVVRVVDHVGAAGGGVSLDRREGRRLGGPRRSARRRASRSSRSSPACSAAPSAARAR